MGNTPADYARRRGHKKICDLFTLFKEAQNGSLRAKVPFQMISTLMPIGKYGTQGLFVSNIISKMKLNLAEVTINFQTQCPGFDR